MKERWNNQLPHNLLQLQNLIKRDPSSYNDEFRQQHTYYQSLLASHRLAPTQENKELEDLVMFLAHVCQFYSNELTQTFSLELMELLRRFSTQLNSDVRLTLCRALILMRNKGLIEPVDLLHLFFEMFRCADKYLRNYLKTHIVADIKIINSKRRDLKLNSKLQSFMYTMLEDNSYIAAKISMEVMVALYRKKVWNDSKTVNVIAEACFSKISKVMVTALLFFVGTDNNEDDQEDDQSEDESVVDLKGETFAARVNKKTRKRKRYLERVKKQAKRTKRDDDAPSFNFSALHLIHDPQSMAERLLQKLSKAHEKFEVKLLMLNLISRLIGVHELIVLNFYPTIQKLLQPHQRDVTKILQYTAQACHELVPPDVLEPIVVCIANNFITERNSCEGMTVGLNAVREICARAPLAMSASLLQDLVQYKTYRDKNVSSAGRSLIQLYRVLNPDLLHRKYRTKPTEEMDELNVAKYGEVKANQFVCGAEVLESDEEEIDGRCDDESDDESGSWVDVSHSEDEGEGNDDGGKEVMSVEERRKRAAEISTMRILSQQDFQKVKAEQLRKRVAFAQPKRFQKKKDKSETFTEGTALIDETPILEPRKELVNLRDIERLSKKPKSDKETRMESSHPGREEGQKFGAKHKKSEFASKTNKESRKNKAYNMIKHKVKRKVKRSFRDKQIAMRDALLKFKRNK